MSKRLKWDDIKIRVEVISLYESGLSTRAIADHFHVSHVTICVKLKGWGVSIRSRGRRKNIS